MSAGKRFFTHHSKSSAMVVSLVLHAVLAVVALSFVAVTVITKNDQKFEAKQVVRPRMPMKKLQVPVKIKRQKRRPRLRQRIVVKHKVRNMPDIKMPEISGIKGGLGATGIGLGHASGIGFSMPEIELFGLRTKGEKVFIALDSSARIMSDAVGGMRAYQIIKDEVERIIEGLGPTTLFNLAVFDGGGGVMLFPRMVPATRENTARVETWLEPLNRVSAGMKANAYGVKTIGKGGTRMQAKGLERGELQKAAIQYWSRPIVEAIVQQADTVFILTSGWGGPRRDEGERPEWPEDKHRKYDEYVQKARAEHKKENERRAAKGEPPRVIGSDWDRMAVYFPAERARYGPPGPSSYYYYTGKDYAEAFNILRKELAAKRPEKSGLSGNSKDRFSLNVVHFVPKNNSGTHEQFRILTNKCRGDLRMIRGLEAIQSYVPEEKE